MLSLDYYLGARQNAVDSLACYFTEEFDEDKFLSKMKYIHWGWDCVEACLEIIRYDFMIGIHSIIGNEDPRGFKRKHIFGRKRKSK